MKMSDKARGAFECFRFDTTLPIFKIFAIVVSVFNLVLLIPDITNISGPIIWRLIAVRILYSTALLSSLFWVGRIKSFRLRSYTMTLFELFALLIFLYVFRLYPEADFFIQTLGVMMIIMVIFMIPNMIILTISLTVLSTALFLVQAKMQISTLTTNYFYAVMVYLIFEICVGSAFMMLFRRYQYREFVAKTELERIYSTDPLTKIGNRVKLEEESNKWMAICEKDNLPLSLVLLDVDKLKHINDNHGHLVGDTVLYETAQILRSNLRENDVCVRWGGDEFILLLPCLSVEKAYELAVRVRDAITAYEFSARIEISCSFGITQMQKGQSLDQLIAQADASMYLAKEHGKNAIEVATTFCF